MHPETDTDLRAWLANLNLADWAESFIGEGWQGEKLLELSREDLADLGIPKERRGAVMLAVEALRQGDTPPVCPDPPGPSYAPDLTAAAIARCQALGRQPPVPWVEAVADTWPGPMAHEYQRLRELLEQGQIVAAVFQLKDLAEVLIKFPALVMARDLIEHGDPEAARAVRLSLFDGPLSMGHWVNHLVRKQLAPQVKCLASSNQLFLPELSAAFITENKAGREESSSWSETLNQLVTWRNETLGHGAFHLDPQEYLPELERWLAAINQHLAEQVAQGLWADVALRDETGALPLNGWQAIRHWHDGDASAHHDLEAPLVLECHGQTLRLAPLIALRRCTFCAKQDVFLYDTRHGRNQDSRFVLLDYLGGHRLTLPAHRATALTAETRDLNQSTRSLPDREVLDEDYGDQAINQLLESRLLESRYLRPDYLREPLRAFVNAHQRGLFWLTAPAHTGKSIFAHSLAVPTAVGEPKPLWSETAVVAFHVRSEFKTSPEQFRVFLTDRVLRQAFGREPGNKRLPELDVAATDPASALVDWLHQAFRLKPDRLARLVLIIDGLDELPSGADGEVSLVDFIPRPERLPGGCFLLLTSRPLAECPPQVNRALADRFTGCTDFGRYALNLDDASSHAYRQLLRAYFDQQMEMRLKSELHQALAEVVRGQNAVCYRNDLSQLSRLAKFAKDEWNMLTKAVKVVERKAPSLAKTIIQPLLDRYDAAFTEVLHKKANGRFLYVAHLTDLLRDQQLDLAGIADLPVGRGLYAYYLRQLEQTLVGPGALMAGVTAESNNKPLAFVRRVILTLAAAEQAHLACADILPASLHDDGFYGMPLAILAGLLDEPGHTVRLTFTLYSLNGILTAWKGEDARDARYALGLKDFVATVADLWPEALMDCHHFLATQTLEAFSAVPAGATTLDLLDQWRLLYIVPHVNLSGQESLQQQLIASVGIKNALRQISDGMIASAQYVSATCYSTFELVISEWRIAQEDNPANRVHLARAYMSRASARAGGGDLTGALADHQAAIGLLETLRQQTGAAWLPEWSDTLADALMNRSHTYGTIGHLSEARADCNFAIALWKEARRQIGPKWPRAWEEKLAGAYANRGNAYAISGDLAAAQADHETAIRLSEGLRRKMGTDWPPAYANHLASAYMSRGNVHSSCGDLTGALANYDRAMALQEEEPLKAIGADRSPGWVNTLVEIHTNRGIARCRGGHTTGALADYNRAIELMTQLSQRPGPDWSPELTNTLAQICLNRGITRSEGGDLAGALADYDKAITLLEELRKTRQIEDWSLAWTRNLAGFYHSRGKAHSACQRWVKALADYDTAIALFEEGRQQMDENCPPKWTYDLATVYANRGIVRGENHDSAGEQADYQQAITFMETLREQMGKSWPLKWANDLASVYMYRAFALRIIDQTKEAIADGDRAAQLYVDLIEQDLLHPAMQLLKIAALQFDGFRALNDCSLANEYPD